MVEGLRRVVVTGLGAVTPIGNDVSQYWDGLRLGSNGVAPITLFDASRHACRFAAEVKDFDPGGVLDRKETKRWDRFCQFGVVASKQAVDQAQLLIDESTQHRIGVAIGSGVGGLLMMESQAHVLADRGPDRVSPFCVPMMIPNMAAGLTAIALGRQGSQQRRGHRLRRRLQRHRRCLPADPARPGRRHGLRRSRIGDHSPGGGRLRQCQGPLLPQR